MSPVIMTLLVLLGVGLLLALWLMGIYNGLVVAGNRFKNAFAQIDVQLKRRYELIPNLVEAVKGYMGHVWTAPGWQGESSLCSIGRCIHVFGLFARYA